MIERQVKIFSNKCMSCKQSINKEEINNKQVSAVLRLAIGGSVDEVCSLIHNDCDTRRQALQYQTSHTKHETLHRYFDISISYLGGLGQLHKNFAKVNFKEAIH